MMMSFRFVKKKEVAKREKSVYVCLQCLSSINAWEKIGR